MSGCKAYVGGAAGFERFLPATGAEAPLVARGETAEAVLRHGCTEVVADARGVRQELVGAHHAHHMHAGVVAMVLAAARAIVAGDRVE